MSTPSGRVHGHCFCCLGQLLELQDCRGSIDGPEDVVHNDKQRGITATAFHLRGIAYLAFRIRIMTNLSGYGLWAAFTPLEGLFGDFQMLPDLSLPA